MDLSALDPALLAKWNCSVPRYTSYPTAPQFQAMEEAVAISHLRAFDASDKSLSLYIHIPFCRSMCLFCGCSVILNRNGERQAAYLEHLFQEIDLWPSTGKRPLVQLHLGGGTPTSLTEEEFERLMEKLKSRFVWGAGAEISI